MSTYNYSKRVVDDLLRQKLESTGIVLVEGPKWCGKTTTSEQVANSVLYVADPSQQKKLQILLDTNLNLLLDGKTPRLIDEWQDIPQIWDAARYEVDRRKEVGQFILTGSAVPLTDTELDKIHHTGTGRVSRIRMRPMSLWESGDSNGQISLQNLFENPDTQIYSESNTSLEDIAYLMCRGGWPIATRLQGEAALETAFSYYEAVTEIDVSRVDDIKKNPSRIKRLMRSLARQQGTSVSISALRQDIIANDVETLSEDSISRYVNALKKIFVVEDLEAWNPNLRSKTAIRTADTRYFVDPSIATAALGVGPKDLINDLETMGLLFETMAIRDLRTYAESLHGNVYHYRDSKGLECDAVIHLRNGKYGLIEIKLGGESLIEQGAATLNKLSSLIDTTKMLKPSFKMVLTAVGNLAYLRKDGVYVVPICCLRNY